MSGRSQHPGLRRGFARMLVAAFAACAMLPWPSAAQGSCNPTSAGFLYLHPFFAGKDWQPALRDVDLTLPDAACALQPRFMSISAAAGENAAVFFAAAGGLYVMQSQDACTACLCCRCVVGFFDPAQLDVSSLPVAAGSPVHVIRQSGYTFDTVRFAVAGPGGRILVITAAGDASAIQRVDTLAMSGITNQSVRFLGGALNSATSQDTGLWVAGTRGLLRLFPYNGAAWGMERNFDVANTDTILCVNGGLAGGWSGRIYSWNGAQFVQQSRPTNAPMRSVGAQAAAGDSGVVLIRRGAGWRTFRTGIAGSLRYVNLVKSGAGSAAELLDAAWGYHRYVYQDSATRIASVSPAEADSHINAATPYVYRGSSSLPLTLTLADADGNFTVPQLRLSGRSVSFDNDGMHTLKNAQPDAACSLGVLVMADSGPTITLDRNQVTFAADARLGAVDAQCGGCKWVPHVFSSRQTWKDGETLVIVAGQDTVQDTLMIVNNPPQTSVLRREPRLNHGAISCRISGTSLIVQMSPIGQPLRRLTFTNGAGRVVFRIDHPGAGLILRMQDLPAGIFCMQAELAGGRVVRMPLANTR